MTQSSDSEQSIDWSRLYSICVGMIGIQPEQFWRMSPIEINLAIAGFKEFNGVKEDRPLTADELNELMELHPD